MRFAQPEVLQSGSTLRLTARLLLAQYMQNACTVEAVLPEETTLAHQQPSSCMAFSKNEMQHDLCCKAMNSELHITD